jgi:hypothetical protein
MQLLHSSASIGCGGIGAWRSLDQVEFATLEWVAWSDTQRLMEPLGYLPPVEYEEQYSAHLSTHLEPAGLNQLSLRKTRGDSVTPQCGGAMGQVAPPSKPVTPAGRRSRPLFAAAPSRRRGGGT